MTKKAFISTVLAAAMGLTSLVPAVAMPVAKTAPAVKAPEVVQVQYNQFHRPGPGLRRWGPPPGYYRGVPPGYYFRGGIPYYNGYRGRRHWKRGWRRHNGWWFPAAAFAVGVIIGNGLNQGGGYYYRDRPRRVYRSGALPGEHYVWCDRRYRTYRVYDNSYVPRVGYRAQCRSPYWP